MQMIDDLEKSSVNSARQGARSMQITKSGRRSEMSSLHEGGLHCHVRIVYRKSCISTLQRPPCQRGCGGSLPCELSRGWQGSRVCCVHLPRIPAMAWRSRRSDVYTIDQPPNAPDRSEPTGQEKRFTSSTIFRYSAVTTNPKVLQSGWHALSACHMGPFCASRSFWAFLPRFVTYKTPALDSFFVVLVIKPIRATYWHANVENAVACDRYSSCLTSFFICLRAKMSVMQKKPPTHVVDTE